jgi:transposase-like protein
VEVDETYVGGKNQPGSRPGRGTKKTPVLAMIGRQGGTHTRIVNKVDGKTLKSAIREVVLPDSRIMTDNNTSYKGIGKEYAGGHHTVNHLIGEYSRGDVHVNNAEAYFALLKRGVHGTFHHVSKKHLGRYCHEFSFRWNRRKINDGERCTSAIAQMGGKRLTYAKLTEDTL